ncbi:MAG TPA: transcriptional regulator [Thermoanaerobaculia bacterium]
MTGRPSPASVAQGLDELIHAPVRLAAMSILAAVDDAEFTYLRERTGATDGNLGAHLRRLEDAGYVAATKSFEDRKPVTRYHLTRRGREAFRRYVDRLETMLSGGGER